MHTIAKTTFSLAPALLLLLSAIAPAEALGANCADFSGTYELSQGSNVPAIARIIQKGCSEITIEEPPSSSTMATTGIPTHSDMGHELTQETIWFHSQKRLRSVVTVLTKSGVPVAVVSTTFQKSANGDVIMTTTTFSINTGSNSAGADTEIILMKMVAPESKPATKK